MWNSFGETTKEIVVVADRRRVRMPKRRVGRLAENQTHGGRLRFGLPGLESLGTSFDIRRSTLDLRPLGSSHAGRTRDSDSGGGSR
jgi:hypothetical protein